MPPKFDGGKASTLVRHDGMKYIQDELETAHNFIETDFFRSGFREYYSQANH
jgi:hypothetical protein